jgi:hypothetical protein
MEPDALRRPLPYWVISPREPPSEVGVKALDSASRATDPTGRPWPAMVIRDEGVPFPRVAEMSGLDLRHRHGSLSLAHSPSRFE